jgi:sec-independent protein translocase protein TatB
MFDIGWGELLLIGIVALIAIGPKELPTVLRALGQWTAKLRRMASDFQNQFHEAMREAEMADLKKQVDEMASEAKSYTKFDPIGDIRREFESTQRQIESAIADKPSSTDSSNATSPSDASSPALAPATSGQPAIAPPSDDPGARDAGGKPA